MGLADLLAELRRRRVFRAVAWYAGAALVVMQAAASLFPALGLPDWSVRLVIGACVVGLPLVVALSWVFDLQPTAASPAPATASPGWNGPSLWIALVTVAAFGVLVGVLGQRWWARPAPTDLPRLAVLPFANLNGDAETAAIAGGFHDTLITQLAKLSGLGVISRTSVLGYAETKPRIADVARELGVTSVLEGSVQRHGAQVRITAQLIDARTDEHVWAETYTEESADLFALQSAIAQRVVEALRVRLTRTERAALTDAPTVDTEAYRIYLLARERWGQPYGAGENAASRSRSVDALLASALARDADFALALALRAHVRAELAWADELAYDVHSAAARAAAERAIELRPGLPEAHFARAALLHVLDFDFPAALLAYQQAAAGMPNDALLQTRLAAVYAALRQPARARSAAEHAVLLDPKDTNARWVLQLILNRVGTRDEILRSAQALAALHPRDPEVVERLRAEMDLDAAGLRAVREKIRARIGANPLDQEDVLTLVEGWMEDGDGIRAFALLHEARPEHQPDASNIIWGHAAACAGDMAEARRSYEAARDAVRGILTHRLDRFQEALRRAQLSRLLAILGDRTGALAELQAADRLYPLELDSFDGTRIQEWLTATEVALGERDAAVARLRRLARDSSVLSTWWFWNHASYLPLHTEPGFLALMGELGVDTSREAYPDHCRWRIPATVPAPAP